jgi:hypothetical protein
MTDRPLNQSWWYKVGDKKPDDVVDAWLRNGPGYKPFGQSLEFQWYSQLNKNGQIEWLEHEAGQQPPCADAKVWRRGPLGNKRILYVQSPEDVSNFADDFGCKSPVKGCESMPWVRWDEVGKKYDGMVVGPDALHFNEEQPLAHWDVPSLCLWRNVDTDYQVEEVGKTNSDYQFIPTHSVVNSNTVPIAAGTVPTSDCLFRLFDLVYGQSKN